MSFFSFGKKKYSPKSDKGSLGIKPLKFDTNLPPIESIKPHPDAPETPEFNPSAEPFPHFDEPSQSPRPLHQLNHPMEKPSAFQQSQNYQEEISTKDISKNIELISAKLDAIKAMIENLNHRMDKIENKDKKETLRW